MVMLESMLPMQGIEVPSLGERLRSCMSHSMAKNKKNLSFFSLKLYTILKIFGSVVSNYSKESRVSSSEGEGSVLRPGY